MPISDLLESAMQVAGIRRYLSRQDKLAKQGAAAERDDYASLIRDNLLAIAERIDKALDDDDASRRKSPLLIQLKEIGGITTAYIVLATLLSNLNRNKDKSKLATSIGTSLELEYKFSFISTQQPAMWKRLVTFAKSKGSYRHKTRFVLNTAAKDGLEVPTWDTTQKTQIGYWLIDLVAEEKLIECRVINKSATDRRSEVALSEHVIEWLCQHRKRAEIGDLPMITPIYSPMVTPPLDWTTPDNGGYLELRYPLVNCGNADYERADMARVYRAVNAIQQVRWTVSAPILDVVERLWAGGCRVGKLPDARVLPEPERVPDAEWQQLSPEQRKGLRLRNRDIYDHNRQAISDLASIGMVLEQARALRDAPAFWLPYQLDFRGRIYCVPLFNPQGPDYIRAMFQFATGKPLGEAGARWLARQCATLWDGCYRGQKLSKASFAAREAWTRENEAMLRSIVADPYGNTQWHRADKPFMFLRTAQDWISYLDYGPGFISKLPIALDGSCSGIQHYSAMLRDPDGAGRVNLVPGPEPRDIYSDVAEAVLDALRADLPDDRARWWLEHGIDRKIVKKPTMTYGYSSREAGFTEWYEMAYVRPALKAQGQPDRPSNPLARYLARKTLAAVETLLPAVARGMDWLIAGADALSAQGRSIRWTAPSGFPVVQRYTAGGAIRVDTRLGGKKLSVWVPGATEKINREKQRNAVAPNHTHSLDAAHLVFTVLRACELYEIRNFLLIHDSFGTLAADADNMSKAVREAFVKMYEEFDPLAHFRESNNLDMPLPEKGNFDLRQVLTSHYAFA